VAEAFVPLPAPAGVRRAFHKKRIIAFPFFPRNGIISLASTLSVWGNSKAQSVVTVAAHASCCEAYSMVQRILVVDDDPELVRLLGAYLEREGFQVLTAYDGESALHILRRDRPDLVLLDLMLPDRDGWEVIRIVRADPSLRAMPIIMLTARVEDHDRILGLELGADDYVTKPYNPCEILARVRAVLRRVRGEAVQSRVLQAGPLTIDLDAHQTQVAGQPLHLTPTEFALLQGLAEHQGHAMTRSELIEKGLGYSYEGLERTVDSHIKNLRRKLEDTGAAGDLIETVFGVGYRMATGGEA
jgi:two-component system, OmpR family, alkaline phosphatase synthesis response regulator PhoP